MSIKVVTVTDLFFTADLTREIGGKIYLEFMQLSSYEGENTTGTIKLKKDIDFSEIKGKDVLIIEDIVDTGITLNYTLEHIKKAGANSVKVCTLLNKPSRRKIKVPIDYVGFEIENKFVLGYGMDYDQLYRNLPYIGYDRYSKHSLTRDRRRVKKTAQQTRCIYNA